MVLNGLPGEAMGSVGTDSKPAAPATTYRLQGLGAENTGLRWGGVHKARITSTRILLIQASS